MGTLAAAGERTTTVRHQCQALLAKVCRERLRPIGRDGPSSDIGVHEPREANIPRPSCGPHRVCRRSVAPPYVLWGEDTCAGPSNRNLWGHRSSWPIVAPKLSRAMARSAAMGLTTLWAPADGAHNFGNALRKKTWAPSGPCP